MVWQEKTRISVSAILKDEPHGIRHYSRGN